MSHLITNPDKWIDKVKESAQLSAENCDFHMENHYLQKNNKRGKIMNNKAKRKE